MTLPHTALVTGGAGFIGSHMVDLCLARGMRVHVLDNMASGRLANLAHHAAEPRLSVDQRDIRSCSPDDAIFADVDYVFHFAGIGDLIPSIERPLDYLSVNVQGTIHMLEGARSSKCLRKFVYAASSSCYGFADVPTREDQRHDAGRHR
jgi:UDP-glucose 4-epimerase